MTPPRRHRADWRLVFQGYRLSMSYPSIEAGQKVDLDWRKDDYKIACCDCHLVHRFRFTVVGNKLRIRGWRDNRSTAALRRWRGQSNDPPLKG